MNFLVNAKTLNTIFNILTTLFCNPYTFFVITWQPLHFGTQPVHFINFATRTLCDATATLHAATPTLWRKIGQNRRKCRNPYTLGKNRAKSDPSAHRPPARSIARPIAGHWINCPPICPHCIARAYCRPPYCPPFCMRPPAVCPIAGQLTRSPDQSPARNIAARYWVTMGKKKPPSVGAIMPGLNRSL
jgi:hypothetical protein